MLNINPMNSYSKSNINFKTKKDYSKIYKSMKKNSVVKKSGKSHKSYHRCTVPNNKTKGFNTTFEELKSFINDEILMIGIVGLTLLSIGLSLINRPMINRRINSDGIEVIDYRYRNHRYYNKNRENTYEVDSIYRQRPQIINQYYNIQK